MTKKRGLGSKRGLDALIGSIKKEQQFGKPDVMTVAKLMNDGSTDDKERPTLLQIDVNCLQSGKYQPRLQMSEDSLGELADSIREHGVMQPIVIRPLPVAEQKASITHEIVAGERRWRAAKMVGLGTIAAIERHLSDDVAIVLALIENIQREELTVLEQAAALERFHREFGMSHATIAQMVGKARTTISNLLRLNQLHDDVKALMEQELLDMGHARTLLALPKKQQPIIAKKIAQAGMSVRDAEKLVKTVLNPEAKKTAQTHSHEIQLLTDKLCDAFGTTVKLKHSKNGKGSIEIFFYGHDEFGALLARFGVENQ
ncbi:MAG: ParB/RepB/Spo0J family partition protein [Moraxella sp.]|nr:ParB/RepB/Spo0J family partition protein [Moraxella sp.]